MDIFINGEKIDFSIEREKNLGELVKHLNSWVSENHYFIDSLKINGVETDPDEAEASSLEIQNILKIELNLKGNLEQIEEVIPALKSYLLKFIHEIEKGKDNFIISKKEKLEGLIWIIDSIQLITKNLNIEPRHIFQGGKNLEETLHFIRISLSTLNQSVHDSDFFYQYFKDGILEKLKSLIFMTEVLVDFYNYLTDSKNKKMTGHYLKELNLIKNSLKQIPENLQKGLDQDAIADTQKLMCFFESLFLLFSKTEIETEEKEELENQKNEVIDLLNQVYEAFLSKDIVSVSDIIEYEVGEKLEYFQSVLEKLI
ncbi:MAG TPA: hypothetical protein DHW82_09205 [Spirochaetia bacterium]|nr:MAG: hypothetical protein A2Y41_08810 [Spirochaetes bacterium GWB1_36_13]HCL57167.1 hypothetical protein [Spirochaetia bacterium]